MSETSENQEARTGCAPTGGYAATLQTITDAPTTWLGGILAHTVKECLRRKFFKDADWLQHFVRRVTEEDKPHNDRISDRADNPKREYGNQL